MIMNRIIGMTEKEATDLLDFAKLKYRIICRDGEKQELFRNFNPERLNLTILNGIVVKVEGD